MNVLAIIDPDESLKTGEERGSQLGVSNPEGNEQIIIKTFQVWYRKLH